MEFFRKYKTETKKIVAETSETKKIIVPRLLAGVIKELVGKKVVLTGGVFDFLKPYHIDLFEFAKGRGDILVVAVESAGKYTPPEERLEILDAIGNIDFLFEYSDLDDLNLIGGLVSEVVVNDEFKLSGDKISFSNKVIKFAP